MLMLNWNGTSKQKLNSEKCSMISCEPTLADTGDNLWLIVGVALFISVLAIGILIYRPARAKFGLMVSLLMALCVMGAATMIPPHTAYAAAGPSTTSCTPALAPPVAGQETPATPSVPRTMQEMTKAYCATMDIYTANNDEDKVLTLTDSRGGTTQSYRVAKLADGNCWMLDNLKLGSATATVTLTPDDSDVSGSFILPQVVASHAFLQQDKDIAYVFGPIPGDTGADATNYGYLYSWPASTAGATRVTNPAGSGNAASSICASGWKLPSGGVSGDYSNLSIAFGGSGTGNNTVATQLWQYSGPFKGVYSGTYWPTTNPSTVAILGAYVNQGLAGRWWTSTTSPSDADLAYRAGINPTFNSPANPGAGNRYDGAAVRCVLR